MTLSRLLESVLIIYLGGVFLNMYKVNLKQLLNEARLTNLRTKTTKETPKLASRSDFVTTDYIGISKFGIFNFRTTSQTNPGNYWYQTLEIPDLESRVMDEDITPELIKELVEQSDIKIYCDCQCFLYYALKFMAYTKDYGIEPETRSPKRNNVQLKGRVLQTFIKYGKFNTRW